MDAGMSSAMSTAVVLLVAAFAAGPAYAQALHDPMRPPSSSSTARDGDARGPQGPVLQSVILSQGRKLALIDGKTYAGGDKVGDAKLIAISASEVTLRASAGNKVLRLTPEAQKTFAAPAKAARRAARTKGQ